MSVQTLPRPPLDDPQKRLLWILPAAIVVWIVMLSVFSLILGQRNEPQQQALDAQIIEIPPPPPPIAVGLQGNGKPGTSPVVKPAPVHHTPVHHKVAPSHPTMATPKVALPEPAAAASAGGAESGPANPPEGAGIGSKSGPPGEGDEEGSGSGSGAGSDSSGARAIVAPTPVIPDDLREYTFEAEAVARFTVASDGSAKVVLIKPTNNPRINEILLDTLAKWQFFPAVRNGEPIDSTVDIRIPISVR